MGKDGRVLPEHSKCVSITENRFSTGFSRRIILWVVQNRRGVRLDRQNRNDQGFLTAILTESLRLLPVKQRPLNEPSSRERRATIQVALASVSSREVLERD